MSQFQIAVIVGSLRRDSINQKLARAIMTTLAPPDFLFKEVRISDLPLYNQDDDENPADPVKRLKSEIAAAQGILFVTPECNRSIPGVLKNVLDHASRPYGQNVYGRVNRREYWELPSGSSAHIWRNSICAMF